MEQMLGTFWEKVSTDPVAAMLAGFIGATIIISILKRLLRRGG